MAWLCGVAVALAAWVGLTAAAGDASFDLETLRALCLAVNVDVWGVETIVAAALMWILMSVAMMLPTALPAIGLFAQLNSKERRGVALASRVGAFAGGYLVAWGVASIGLAATQAALHYGGALSRGGDAIGPTAGAALLIGAGLYQFSALKRACLTKCRNPMAFFFAHWREGDGGAFQMGLRHGAICVGCCWALMLLMFVFGLMNLIWMAALGALMLLEKAAPFGDVGGRWLGATLIVAGLATMVQTLN